MKGITNAFILYPPNMEQLKEIRKSLSMSIDSKSNSSVLRYVIQDYYNRHISSK